MFMSNIEHHHIVIVPVLAIYMLVFHCFGSEWIVFESRHLWSEASTHGLSLIKEYKRRKKSLRTRVEVNRLLLLLFIL
jgi:hypothetical protein